MKTNKRSRATKDRIEELERRVRELEARPPAIIYPITVTPAPVYPMNPWPTYPYPWIVYGNVSGQCESVSGGTVYLSNSGTNSVVPVTYT